MTALQNPATHCRACGRHDAQDRCLHDCPKCEGTGRITEDHPRYGRPDCPDELGLPALDHAGNLWIQKEVIRSLRASIDAEQTLRADLRAADVAMARGYGGGS